MAFFTILERRNAYEHNGIKRVLKSYHLVCFFAKLKLVSLFFHAFSIHHFLRNCLQRENGSFGKAGNL